MTGSWTGQLANYTPQCSTPLSVSGYSCNGTSSSPPLLPSRPASAPTPHSYRPNRGIKRGDPAMGTFLSSLFLLRGATASGPHHWIGRPLAPAAPPTGTYGYASGSSSLVSSPRCSSVAGLVLAAASREDVW
jgi:hypothetical protein